MARGRRIAVVRFRVSLDQSVAFGALHVLLGVGYGWLVVDAPRAFDLGGAALQALIFVSLLVLAWAAARETQPHRLGSTVLVFLSALWPIWIVLAFQATVPAWQRDADFSWVGETVQGGAMVWGFCILVRALEVGCGLAGVRAFALVLFCAGGSLAMLNHIEVEPYWTTDWYALWEQRQTESADTEEIDAEALMFAQHELLLGMAGELELERPGVADLYFVGFAADASQAVFRREVLATRKLFDTRFDTVGRSAVLVNHAATREELPIASGSNLGFMLHEIAARMNTDEDILFLFLTGHGSKTHELSVKFDDLPLNTIESLTLDRLLDEAGIRWRVIVISACYAGGFIDGLANDETLVLTAAASDRRSFGCSNEAEWTWFGKAFFEEALAEEIDFEIAFERARSRIDAWEQEDEKTHSLPQISAGASIRAKLEFLELRLTQALADEPSRRAALGD